MCKSVLSEVSTSEILKELYERGLMTNAKSNDVILSNLNEIENVKLILTKGIPVDNMECRECRITLSPEHFSYYLSRVDQKGYLMRNNALCDGCSVKSNKQRKTVLDRADVPRKPKKGEKCPNCERSWIGKWHRHHKEENFISWLCGHCNMSFSDQRNKFKSGI